MSVPKPGFASGAWTAAIGLLGGAAVIYWPNQMWVAQVLFGLAAGVLLWAVKIDGEHWWHRDHINFIRVIGALVFALLFGMFVYKVTPTPVPTAPQASAPAPAKPTDIVTKLVVDGFHGDNVDGHFELTNTSSGVLSIGKMLEQVSGSYAKRDDGSLPRSVSPGEKIDIPLNPINHLKTFGVARLQFEYSISGSPAPPKPYMVQFDLSPNFKPGTFSHALCCDMAIDIDYAMDKENQRILDEDRVGHMTFTFRRSDGYVAFGSSDGRKLFAYEPAINRARFAYRHGNVQKLYDAYPGDRFPTFFLDIKWNDDKATASMTVDDVPAPLSRTIRGPMEPTGSASARP